MNRFFSQISMAFNLLIRHFFVNLILIVLLCISVLFSNFAIIEVKSIPDNYDIVFSLPSHTTVLYMVSYDVTKYKGNNFLDLSEINSFYSVGKVRYGPVNDNSRMYFYSKALIDNLAIPLSEGNWNCSVKTIRGTNYYPIIISKETSQYQYGKTAVIRFQNGTYINVYVCGVLSSSQKFVNLTMSTNSANSDHLIKECNPDTVTFFGIDELYPNFAKDITYECDTRFIFFEDNITSEQFNRNYNIIKNQGYAYTYEQLLNNSQYHIKQGYTYYIPLLICLLLLCTIGIVSFTVLSIKNNQYYYSCFLLCGGRKKDCVNLSLINVLLIILISFLITFFITNLLVQTGALSGWYKITLLNVVCTLIIYLFNLFVSWVITKLALKNKTVLQLLKVEV